MTRTEGTPELTDDDLQSALRALRADTEDAPAFLASLRQRLAREAVPPSSTRLVRWRDAWNHHARWLWPAVGVAVGGLAFSILTLVRSPPPLRVAQGPDVSEVVHRMPASHLALVRVTFSSSVAIEDVAFEVVLPDGLSFWSEGQVQPERSFRWHGKLEAGDNPLPVAVRGDRPGRYRLTASAEAGGRRIEHAVVLEVTSG